MSVTRHFAADFNTQALGRNFVIAIEETAAAAKEFASRAEAEALARIEQARAESDATQAEARATASKRIAEMESSIPTLVEKEVVTTLANGWEDLTFDYSAINTANSYSKVVVIFDNVIVKKVKNR
jgi:regulator of protease activity HflC (stomatin/prohibitin superfamily)